jgi:hypothetical protein
MSGLGEMKTTSSEMGESAPEFSLQRGSDTAAYGVALLDRYGSLLGACSAASLPGEVAMPLGLNLRTHDLRSYLGEDRGFHRPRRFPLASATWMQVRGRQVRVGIYVESGGPQVVAEAIEPDLASVAAILSGQLA